MKRVLKKIIRSIWVTIKIIGIIILIPIIAYTMSWSYHRLSAFLNSAESRWIKDLNAFERAILDKHVNPDWISSRTTQVVRQRIDSLRNVVAIANGVVNKDSMRVAMMQIAALLQDGHTHIANYKGTTGEFPIKVQFYREGLFIVEANLSLKHVVGHKITAVDGVPIERVLNKIRTISPSSNISSQKMYAEIYIKNPAMLYGLGVTKNSRSAVFSLETIEGSTSTILFNGFEKASKKIHIDDLYEHNRQPLHSKNIEKAYWYAYDSKKALLYLKYDKVLSMGNDPMDSFVDRLMRVVDSVNINKFVIDISHNRGGDNFLTAKLVTEIQKRPKVNKKGVLYVITGHQTFSAAICFAGNLSTRTHATFVGTPFADYNNLPGDAKFFDLHMNRITWQVSEMFWENTYYGDSRKTIVPAIAYERSFKEEINGEDPLIDLILNDHRSDTPSLWKPVNQSQLVYNGRYKFSPDKTLHLDLSSGRITISGLMESDLKYVNDSVFRAENLQLNLFLGNGQLVLRTDHGAQRVLEKMGSNEFTALELIQMGEYSKARNQYLSLKKQFGNKLAAIAANNLSTTAHYLYLGTDNNRMQTELLKITVEMYPDQMMPLGRMSVAASIDKKTARSFFYKLRSFWYFDWKNIDNYAKAFGFL